MKTFRITLVLASILAACSEEGDVEFDELTSVEYIDLKSPPFLSDYLPVNGITEDSTGTMWFGTGAGIAHSTNGQVTVDLDYQFTNTAFTDSRGTVWFGTTDGPIYRDKDGIFWNVFGSGNSMSTVAIAEDKDGQILVGAEDYGVILLDPPPVVSADQWLDDDCSECNYVNALLKDRQGNIWIGSNGDLKKYDGTTFTSYGPPDGLPEGVAITALFESSWDIVWVGTANGLFKFSDGKFVEQPLRITTTKRVTSIGEDSRHRLIVGVFVYGFVRFDGLTMKSIYLRRNDDDNKLYAARDLYRDSQGYMWLGFDECVVKIR